MSMEPEAKPPAELKQIRIARRQAQAEEGVKAMAEIAASDIAVRQRMADLRAQRLARDAAAESDPPPSKVTKSKKKSAS